MEAENNFEKPPIRAVWYDPVYVTPPRLRLAVEGFTNGIVLLFILLVGVLETMEVRFTVRIRTDDKKNQG